MIYAVLLAGGQGTRLGLPVPKQFLKLGGKTLLEHNIEKFLVCQELSHIVVVVPKMWMDQSKKILEFYSNDSLHLCVGGESRQDSLFNGLNFLKNKFEISDDDIVISHDVARPFVTYRIIQDNVKCCRKFGAADTVIPATDTIVQSDDGCMIEEVPIRKNLYVGQTPQTFFINEFIEIYKGLSRKYLDTVTDAAKILKDAGVKEGLVFGDQTNIKITTQFDLSLANYIIESGKGE